MNERDLLASELALARLRSEEWETIPTPELRSLVEAASEETFTTHIGPEGVLFWQLYEGAGVRGGERARGALRRGSVSA